MPVFTEENFEECVSVVSVSTQALNMQYYILCIKQTHVLVS